MNYSKMLCFVGILSSLVLSSCASTTQVTELSTELRNLSNKIDQIDSNINILEPEVEKARSEAIRANKRLDNQISIYRK